MGAIVMMLGTVATGLICWLGCHVRRETLVTDTVRQMPRHDSPKPCKEDTHAKEDLHRARS